MDKHRRSRAELNIDVLRAINNGRKSPSRIVCAANLSYDRVMRRIDFLINQNLVERITGDRKSYSITQKGREILHYFDEIESIIYDKTCFEINSRYSSFSHIRNRNTQINTPAL